MSRRTALALPQWDTATITVNGLDIPCLRGHWNLFAGHCPFHHEALAVSFVVSLTTQRYFCFTCGATGEIETWTIQNAGR